MVPITFVTAWQGYNRGETAEVEVELASRLFRQGYAVPVAAPTHRAMETPTARPKGKAVKPNGGNASE